ncbi:MAG: hypothetical protein OEZ22_10360 [Spirochaetia bacterium]|nr:hypothetical protein [Spirochaetia bacterium]
MPVWGVVNILKYAIAILAIPALMTVWFFILKLSKKSFPEKYKKLYDDCEEEEKKEGCGFCSMSDDCSKAKL